MVGLRVEALLVGFTGTLLLGSIRGWEPSEESQLFELSDSVRRAETQGVMSPVVDEEGDDDYYDEDSDPEYRVSEGEGAASIEDYDVETEASDPESRVGGTTDGLQVESEAPPPPLPPPTRWTSSTTQTSDVKVVCNDTAFLITLLTGPLSDVKVLGSKDLVSVTDAPASCGYKVDLLHNTFSSPFTGCNVKRISTCYTNSYSLQLLYGDEFGRAKVAAASCEERRTKFDPSLLLRSGDGPSPKCPLKSTAHPTTAAKRSKTNKKNCAVATGERLACGRVGTSSSDCELMGCCVDSNTPTCFHPLDECTADHQFVFAIRYNSAPIPVDPTKLVVAGRPICKPAIVNDEVAIFQFNVTECGTHSYEVGETNIFLAEVQTTVEALNLKYGIITRSDPLRFMVECRYSKSSRAEQSLISVGYMVKMPPSSLESVLANGLFGVQLRIAKDEMYSSYYPTTSQPLRLLLGSPVYLELHLKSPKPNAVILVNYCIAYPRSARNALVLVYEGCANPHDPNVFILQVSDLAVNRHQRRFVVRAFQFMDQKTNKYLDEEIYFMCSSEVCWPTEKTCVERCFDGKAIL